jgi:hypothetical protein
LVCCAKKNLATMVFISHTGFGEGDNQKIKIIYCYDFIYILDWKKLKEYKKIVHKQYFQCVSSWNKIIEGRCTMQVHT